MTTIEAHPLDGIPEVTRGDDLATLILAAKPQLETGDVLCVAHKIVSKAENRVVNLGSVVAGTRARLLAEIHGKDARHIQVVLDETTEIVRDRAGVIICRTRHGFVCANAGVDASNTGGVDRLILLPLDPDSSARKLRAALNQRTGISPAVVITDSFGRAWRRGQVETAIGLAGLAPIDAWDGRVDSDGRPLTATAIAVADQAAAAADLARAKDSREPVILVRGLGHHVQRDDGPGAADLIRARDEDLFS